MKIAINGFGRIGRNFLRTILLNPEAAKKLDVVAINIGPADPGAVAHMFKYDTLMGTYPGSVVLQDGELIINDYHIKIIAESDPESIHWDQLGVEWVVESSGRFTKREGASKHLNAGARHVLITAPSKGEDISIVPGVNEELFDNNKHAIVSLGSCTTNAFVTLLKVMHDAFMVTKGFMTTVHAYTNSQVLLDVESSDLRRSRAAALNIIPTSTGASKVLGKVIPELEGVIQAVAIRVPVAKVSLIDLSFCAQKKLSVDAIHDAVITTAKKRMQGILGITMEPLVSSDFSGSNYSVVVDGLLTAVQGDMAKVFGWYDNEWGYSVRLKDFLLYVAQK
ncbi:MAG: glyceraldehyde 3-phosphate dehydrogenase NAD-binding domain-containing protein [bacterium]|nr:glyceraldehyde 3-phosphate dehydrogenase NAD-binding domain-containing protein [bacterium]